MLLVEDNHDLVMMLCALLGDLGHTVQVAVTGDQAVADARSFRPEVVLCDIGLPGERDGYAVARELRQELGHDVYLVAVTGYAHPEDLERARRAGFDCHLHKPLQLHEIQLAIVAATERSADLSRQ